jgi:hypothetical protein
LSFRAASEETLRGRADLLRTIQELGILLLWGNDGMAVCLMRSAIELFIERYFQWPVRLSEYSRSAKAGFT